MSRLCPNCGTWNDDDTNYAALCRDCENKKRRHDYGDTPIADIIEQMDTTELSEWRTNILVEPITVKQRRTEPVARDNRRKQSLHLHVDLTIPLATEVKQLARTADISISAYIRKILALHVQELTGTPVETLLAGSRIDNRHAERKTYA